MTDKQLRIWIKQVYGYLDGTVMGGILAKEKLERLIKRLNKEQGVQVSDTTKV